MNRSRGCDQFLLTKMGRRQRRGGCPARLEGEGKMRLPLRYDPLSKTFPNLYDTPGRLLPPSPLTKGELVHSSPLLRGTFVF